jgi:aldehyde dehydrogenase (NAD+)
MRAITKHYIDGAFVESHGRKVMESINPTNQQVLGSVMLGDEEDARRAIAAAKRAFQTYSRTTKLQRTSGISPTRWSRSTAASPNSPR